MLPRSLRPFPLAALLLAAVPPLASAGLFVDTPQPFDPEKIRAVRSQEGVAAAANDSLTLFAWTDFRAGGDGDVYATRVRHDGTVLDPNGIVISETVIPSNLGPLGRPAVSWNGSEWLVSWSDGQTLRATRVATNGEVLDPFGIDIAMSPFFLAGISAAGLGPYHVLAYRHSDISPLISFAVVRSDGSVEGPIDLRQGVFSLDTSPSIAVRGNTGLCAFSSSRGVNDHTIRAFRFGVSSGGPPTLVRLDAADVDVSPGGVGEGAPAVGASANGWLVAWMDDRNSTASGVDIFASRVNASGAVQDAGGIEVSDDIGTEALPAVHHNGNEWLVAWSQQDFGQFLRAVADNGNPAAQRIDVSTASGTLGEGAFGGDPAKPILAWSDPEVGTSAPKPPQDLLGRLVASDLSLETPFVIATQTPNQTQPAMAFASGRWFVAWVDDRFGPTEGRVRYAVTDSARFEPPNPASIGWAALRPGLDQQQPTAAFDGTYFSLFWTEERGGRRQVFGARYTTGGAFVDSCTVTQGAWGHVDPSAAHVSGSGGTLLVAWTDERNPGNRDIYCRRVVAGAPFGDELAVAASAAHEERPNLPPDMINAGNQAIRMVYQKRTGPGNGSIHANDVFLDPFFAAFEDDISPAGPDKIYEAPKIAWNGETWLVTYQELVSNDPSGLHVPWAVWNGEFFDFISDPHQLGPGSYVPPNPIPATTGYNYFTMWSQLEGSKVDLQVRRADSYSDFPEAGPTQFTDDAGADVPGAALKGLEDRFGFLWMKQQDDAEWQGLRLFGADARDSIVGRVVINEFSANPPADRPEFYELFNKSGQSIQLTGWFISVAGESARVTDCGFDLRTRRPALDGGPGDIIGGTLCGQVPDLDFYSDTEFLFLDESPTEGFLPNRGSVLQLFTPGGILVDQVAYGHQGGAPVSPALPAGQAPLARGAPPNQVAAPGDSVELSTARLPNGTDTDDDANDWNLTTNSTQGTSNEGTAAALGTSLFTTRVSWNPLEGPDAIELFNPRVETFDFSNWYIGSNDGTQRIGVPNNAWSVLPSLDKRVLRRGELGSFTTDLDYLTVVYLFDPDFVRVEQIGWSRPDNQQPQLCLKREPDTGGFHNGFDWFTSGGEQNLFAGQIRYVTCEISAPDGTVPVEDGPATLAFRGAIPNPLPAAGGALVFSIPGTRGGAGPHVRLRLVDVAGRVRATLLDGPMAPGEHRVPLAGQGAGIYYAELEVAGRRISKPVVVIP